MADVRPPADASSDGLQQQRPSSNVDRRQPVAHPINGIRPSSRRSTEPIQDPGASIGSRHLGCIKATPVPAARDGRTKMQQIDSQQSEIADQASEEHLIKDEFNTINRRREREEITYGDLERELGSGFKAEHWRFEGLHCRDVKRVFPS
ncbi:hypothetical protein ACLOJK_018836 [Asimina triloba]